VTDYPLLVDQIHWRFCTSCVLVVRTSFRLPQSSKPEPNPQATATYGATIMYVHKSRIQLLRDPGYQLCSALVVLSRARNATGVGVSRFSHSITDVDGTVPFHLTWRTVGDQIGGTWRTGEQKCVSSTGWKKNTEHHTPPLLIYTIFVGIFNKEKR
jgi:hypothetical protein